MNTRQTKIRELQAQLNKLEQEEDRDAKIKSYGRIILKLSSLALSREEKNYLLTCVEERLMSGKVEDSQLDFVGNLKKKLSA